MTLSRKSILLAALLCGVVLSSGVAAAAQDARFTGRVVDPSGAPVADVTITLTNVDNGQVVTIQSDKDGRYFRRSLTLGRYEILFEKDGYEMARDERRLGSGQTTHDVVLTPATVSIMDPGSSPEYAAAFEAFNAGDQARTIEILTPLVQAQPEFLAGLLLLGRSHFELGHWQDAIDSYGRVITMAPEVAIAYLDLGVAYVELGDLVNAKSAFDAAMELQPDDASVHYNIGTIYIRADEVEEAIVHLTRATELDPENALAHKALAFALVRQSDIAGAIQHLERYLEIEPEAADAAEMAALLEQLRGQ